MKNLLTVSRIKIGIVIATPAFPCFNTCQGNILITYALYKSRHPIFMTEISKIFILLSKVNASVYQGIPVGAQSLLSYYTVFYLIFHTINLF
jgi:hypothetical protein